MAAIAVDQAQVALVRAHENGLQSFPASAAFGAATYFTIGADGRAVANDGANGYVAIKRAANPNDAVTGIKDGLIDIGGGLAGLAYGAPVYANGTGALDDAATRTEGASTVNNRLIGHVAPGYAHTSGDKLLKVNL